VAESVINVACAGARAVALVNCLNFGNPEHPEVMWQLSEAIDGMSKACIALDLPVIGGNVSLYNESGGSDIPPTPVIGALGLVELLESRPPGIGWEAGATVLVVHPLVGETPGNSKWILSGILPVCRASFRYACSRLRAMSTSTAMPWC